MGTRGVIKFQDNDDKIICSLGLQCDGYPGGYMNDAVKFLRGRFAERILINGISKQNTDAGDFNGMGDLAACLVAFLKSSDELYKIRRGSFYLEPPEAKGFYIYVIKYGDATEDALYHRSGHQIIIDVFMEYKLKWSGTANDYMNMDWNELENDDEDEKIEKPTPPPVRIIKEGKSK